MATKSELDAIAAARTRAEDAERVAAADPAKLTENDLTLLRPAHLASLMRDGKLGHLGYGGDRRSRRLVS
jgi:hypothetical protein